jgi:PiT family inorganic phosphate transporter
MLSFLAQGSPTTIGFLIACLALVLAFGFSNGFHDTPNAVATVIYTNYLKPIYAVIWSGLMNFLGVLLGGTAVAYALVQLIPPEVLSPPNGGTAVGMLPPSLLQRLSGTSGRGGLGFRTQVRTL